MYTRYMKADNLWCYDKSSQASINRGILDAVCLVNDKLNGIVFYQLGLVEFPCFCLQILCVAFWILQVFLSTNWAEKVGYL